MEDEALRQREQRRQQPRRRDQPARAQPPRDANAERLQDRQEPERIKFVDCGLRGQKDDIKQIMKGSKRRGLWVETN